MRRYDESGLATYLRTCWQLLSLKEITVACTWKNILWFSNSPTILHNGGSTFRFWYSQPGVSIRTPQVKGHSLPDCPHSRCHLKFWATCTPDRSARNWGSPNPLLRFDNLLEWPTELRKPLYLCLLVNCKGYRWQPDGKVHRTRLGRVLSWELLSVELGWVTLLAGECTWMCPTTWKLSKSREELF